MFLCAKPQEAADYIERNFPGQVVHWNVQPRRLNSLGQSFATQIIDEYKSKNTP